VWWASMRFFDKGGGYVELAFTEEMHGYGAVDQRGM
jgi:hypothetical protein